MTSRLSAFKDGDDTGSYAWRLGVSVMHREIDSPRISQASSHSGEGKNADSESNNGYDSRVAVQWDLGKPNTYTRDRGKWRGGRDGKKKFDRRKGGFEDDGVFEVG